MVLGQHQHLSALYLWQSGSLAQGGWGPAVSLTVQLAAGLALGWHMLNAPKRKGSL